MHSHAHGTGRKLTWSFFATLLFVGVESVAGIQSHSLALISDAGHNFTDALALLLAWFAFYLQSKPANETKTYGYHRAGVLSALVNSVTLGILSAWILWESWQRLRNPEPVSEYVMIAVASLGLVLNGGIMWSLHAASRHDLNVRAAFIHMLGDALGSVAIIIGAVLIRITGWQQIDPILSILIAVLIVWTAWDVVRESLNILLEGLPRGLTLQAVAAKMLTVEGVLDVHDLHIWSLGSSTHALSCHVLIEDVPPSTSEAILRRLNDMLCHEYHINHTTVQFEHLRCKLPNGNCVIEGHEAHHHHH